jgi:hypothetical protein
LKFATLHKIPHAAKERVQFIGDAKQITSSQKLRPKGKSEVPRRVHSLHYLGMASDAATPPES